MCFITYKKPVYNIAEEDIEVFKVSDCFGIFDHYFKSLFYQHVYEKDTFQREIKISDRKYPGHSFYLIEHGYHSYSKEYPFNRSARNYRLALFIIPKGTRYTKNSDLEIVSETIIFKNYLNWEDVK